MGDEYSITKFEIDGKEEYVVKNKKTGAIVPLNEFKKLTGGVSADIIINEVYSIKSKQFEDVMNLLKRFTEYVADGNDLSQLKEKLEPDYSDYFDIDMVANNIKSIRNAAEGLENADIVRKKLQNDSSYIKDLVKEIFGREAIFGTASGISSSFVMSLPQFQNESPAAKLSYIALCSVLGFVVPGLGSIPDIIKLSKVNDNELSKFICVLCESPDLFRTIDKVISDEPSL